MLDKHSTPLLAVAALAVSWVLLALPTAEAQPGEPEQHTEEIAEEAPEEDSTKWEVSLGGVLQTGNTEQYTVTGGSLFELVRDRHGFLAEIQGNYGRAVPAGSVDDEYVETAQNVRMRLRYDFFLTRMDAIFAAFVFRHDPFAGLDYRMQGQVGYARYFIREENHKLWSEVGYDLTYDNYDPDPLIVDMMMLDGTEVTHSARVFGGYSNQLNEAVQFRTGLEVLIAVAGDNPGKDFRINWDSSFKSAIGGNFQLELKFLLQYDNVPVPGNEELDTTTQLNLIYTLI